MKNIILILFLLFCSWGNVYPQEKDSTSRFLNGFRNVSWDASREDIRKIELEEYASTYSAYGRHFITFFGMYAGYKATIDYIFVNDRFKAGSYTIEVKDSCKAVFKNVLRQLSNIYGAPDAEIGPDLNADSIWVKKSDYGLYIGPQWQWKFNDGFIILHSSKFKEEITLTLLFLNYNTLKEYIEEMQFSVE